MAVTLDGFIAKEDGGTDFASPLEWESYKNKIKEVGNVVMGRRTYDQMTRNNDSYIVDGAILVVVTHDKDLLITGENMFVAGSPEEAVKILEDKGCATALIGGGGIVNASFLDKGLVDELYLDLEPVAIGKGIGLFEGASVETKFELVEIKNLSKDELQLHYRAIR
jgi:dihydrofolate reductase